MNDKPKEGRKTTHEQGKARILDLADPERGEVAIEFQGYHHNANVSFIVPGGARANLNRPSAIAPWMRSSPRSGSSARRLA